jgi:hypothetical protein
MGRSSLQDGPCGTEQHPLISQAEGHQRSEAPLVWLFRDRFSGTAELCGEVFKLREAVLHR